MAETFYQLIKTLSWDAVLPSFKEYHSEAPEGYFKFHGVSYEKIREATVGDSDLEQGYKWVGDEDGARISDLTTGQRCSGCAWEQYLGASIDGLIETFQGNREKACAYAFSEMIYYHTPAKYSPTSEFHANVTLYEILDDDDASEDGSDVEYFESMRMVPVVRQAEDKDDGEDKDDKSN